jgi:hypothetical protein
MTTVGWISMDFGGTAMALFKRKTRAALAEPQDLPITWRDVAVLKRRRRLEIVGESHYVPHLKALLSRGDSWDAYLIREPKNPYDANAVAVHIDGGCVGYVCRDDALEIAPILDAMLARRQAVMMHVTLWGGTRDKPNVGVFGD